MSKEFIIKHGAKINEGGTLTIGDPATTGYSLPNTAGAPGEVLEIGPGGDLVFAPITTAGGLIYEWAKLQYTAGQILDETNMPTSAFPARSSGVQLPEIVSNIDSSNITVNFKFSGKSFPPLSMFVWSSLMPADEYTYNVVAADQSVTDGSIRLKGFGGFTASSPSVPVNNPFGAWDNDNMYLEIRCTLAVSGGVPQFDQIDKGAHSYYFFAFGE